MRRRLLRRRRQVPLRRLSRHLELRRLRLQHRLLRRPRPRRSLEVRLLPLLRLEGQRCPLPRPLLEVHPLLLHEHQ